MNKTAIENVLELIERRIDHIETLNNGYGINNRRVAELKWCLDILIQSLSVERQQIIKANEDGRQVVVDLVIDYADTNPEELIRRFFHGDYSLNEEATEYFNQTYTEWK